MKQRKPYTTPAVQPISRPAAITMLKEAAAAGSGEAVLMLNIIEARKPRTSERVGDDLERRKINTRM